MTAGYCGANKRQGVGTCTRPAGWGTDHVGSGRCKLHGGRSIVKHGIQSRQYTKNARMQALIEKHLADPNPLDMLAELAKARALFEDWLDRAEEYSEALLAWHASYGEEGRAAASEQRLLRLENVLDEYDALLDQRGNATDQQESDLRDARDLLKMLRTPPDDGRPRKTMDIADGHKILLTIAKIVEGINRKDARLYISRKVFMDVMTRMGLVARGELLKWDGRKFNAQSAADAIQAGWGQIPMA